jgi:hypothetical protein
LFSGIKTKRCVYCQQLSPADADFCQHCLRPFEATDPLFKIHNLSRSSTTPAASHQAGHYPGLHPEDQPYQSNLMEAQQKPPQAFQEKDLPEEAMALDEEDVTDVVPLTPPSLPLPSKSRKRLQPARVLSLALIAFCMMLLIVGSLLAYMFIDKRGGPPLNLTATPDHLYVGDSFLLVGHNFGAADVVKFTSDTNEPLLASDGQPLQIQADGNGVFKVVVVAPASWIVGAHRVFATDVSQQVSTSTTITVLPQLNDPPGFQIANTSLDLGTDRPGVLTHKPFTLSNSGGGSVNWTSKSDQPWLTAQPDHGTFKTMTSITLQVDRSNLDMPGYTGHLTFQQPGSTNPPQVLTVTMQVDKNAPGISGLLISTDALSYSAGLGHNPFDQTITLQNVSDQPLDWSSKVVTENSVSWIAVVPDRGHLEPHASTVVTVQVQSQQLPVGNYQGTLIINGRTTQPLRVTLAVVTAANLQVPSSLTLVATAGQSTMTQTLTIQNAGGQPINWQLNVGTQNGGSWLSAAPQTGHLDLGAQSVVTVLLDARNLKSGSYQGALTFGFGDAIRTCTIFLTVIPSTLPSIALNHASLSFTTMQGSNPAPQSFTLTNSGGTTLDWRISSSQSDQAKQPALVVVPMSGSLEPGKSATILVTPSVDQLPAELLGMTLMVTDARGEPGVQSQQVNVSVLIR